MREFKGVKAIEQAQKILNEYNIPWDVSEHYEMLNTYSFLWKEQTIADYNYETEILMLY